MVCGGKIRQRQDVVVVVSLKPLATFHTPRGLDLADEPTISQQTDRVPRRIFRAAAVESDGLHAGPAYVLLPCAADQVTVHGQGDRLQVIAENRVAHLIKSFTENRHTEPPDFEIQRYFFLRSGCLSVRLFADGVCVFRNAARRRTVAAVSAAFLLDRDIEIFVGLSADEYHHHV